MFSHKYFKQAAQTELLSDNLTFTGHKLELPGAENARHHVFRFFVFFYCVIVVFTFTKYSSVRFYFCSVSLYLMLLLMLLLTLLLL